MPEAGDPPEVIAAIASGEWKEKTDSRTQRRYFVHPVTRTTTWNLEKHLSSIKEIPASHLDSRQVRIANAQSRISKEERLRESVAALERHKVDLEAEVARLKAPSETEAAALLELKRNVADSVFSMENSERHIEGQRMARRHELFTLRSSHTSVHC
jgi:hypothetical protein